MYDHRDHQGLVGFVTPQLPVIEVVQKSLILPRPWWSWSKVYKTKSNFNLTSLIQFDVGDPRTLWLVENGYDVGWKLVSDWLIFSVFWLVENALLLGYSKYY